MSVLSLNADTLQLDAESAKIAGKNAAAEKPWA